MFMLTCGICSFTNKPQKYIVQKLTNFTRRSDLIFKCKKCDSTLNIVRDDSQWKMRWIESPEIGLDVPLKAENI